MDHTLLVLQLVVGLAVLSFVRQNVAGTSYRAAPGFMDNGHTAKKSPMDYSRYAADERDIGSHSGVSSFRGLNECDSRYELKNSSIIRTKDSLNNGAEFVGDTKVDGAAECRWRCCQKEGSCDTAIFVEDESKSKNCFLFRCWHEGTLKCLFSSHWGYVSAIIGGFDDLPPTSQVVSEDDPALTGDEDFHHSVENLQSQDAMNPDEPKGHTEDDAECGTGQIQCASGECIVVRYICNGVDDCTDGSDEMGCKYDTNTPPAHSSHATSPPKVGPTAQISVQNDEDLKIPEKLDLGEVRSNLANELHGQVTQEKQVSSEPQNKDTSLNPVDGESKSSVKDNGFGENTNAGPQYAQYNLDAGSVVNTSDKPGEVPSSVHDSQSDSRPRPEAPDQRMVSTPLRPLPLGTAKEHDGFSQGDVEQRKSGDKDPGDRNGQMNEKTEQLGDPDKPLLSRPTNPRNSQGQDQGSETRSQDSDNQGSRYDDTSKILDQTPRGLGNSYQSMKPGHAVQNPGYNPRGNGNPSRTDADNSLGFSDHDSDDGDGIPYFYGDNYGVYRNKPFANPPDYNYPNEIFKDLTNPGQNYPDLYDDDPLYPDLQETGYDPDQINYHRRDRLNSKYGVQGNKDVPPRQHPYNGGPDNWQQRGGNSGMRSDVGRGSVPRVSGRPYQDRPGPDDGTANDRQQNSPGTWRHWNDYNHGDDGNTYQPRIQDGYNHNGRDGKVEYRPDEADSGGARGGEQTSEDFVDYGSNTKVEGDKETTEDDDEVYIATVAKEHDELPTVPSVPTAQPHPPATAESNSFHTDGRQSSVVTTTRTDHNEQSDQDSSNKVEPFGSHPATSAILPLAVGLIITLLLLMMLSCRLRYMNRRLRYGRLKTHAHDADYLINGMYL
ncbi:uncharacterized protein LOC110978209 [Acanthaster planci]|uniref:Uncharacterized protein LOC110978209 n=1 Tax=Acanthaster planci TaxID=133434 RepID=A0A8B7YAH9_ACAPL|nr:uncharacterized protein LOC110978209 [Acanthaster planci]